MARLRQDPLTWQWVIAGETSPPQSIVPGAPCPFCPSQQAIRREVLISEVPSGPNWLVRVVADRSPLLHAEGELERTGDGIFDTINAIGAHEIIIEGQQHAATPGSLSAEHWVRLLEVFRDRITDLKRDARFRHVEVFQNHGPRAGALLSHPHAQVLAAPVLPHRVERELRTARSHYELKQRCLYCDLLRQELKDEKRIVADEEGFILFCPYASRFPYEMWLLPRRHHSCFEATPSDVFPALARVLQNALGKVERLTASFHFVLHTEPSRLVPPVLAERWSTLSEDYHWHFEILPRVEARRKYLGEEEFYLNPILPEDAARELRQL